jgi:hypothetical protein
MALQCWKHLLFRPMYHLDTHCRYVANVKICTYGSYGRHGTFFFMVYEAHFPILHMVHISMGLVLKMCTHVYTFVNFKYFHVQAHFNLPHKNRYS